MKRKQPTLQLDLFPSAPRRYGRPASVERKWQLAFSDEVKAAMLAFIEAKPGTWLSTWDFREIIERYDIGCCFGHLLYHLSSEGKIERREEYFGSDHPAKPGYTGFRNAYKALSAPVPQGAPEQVAARIA